MRIKNTRELVLRAQAHARQDHVKQGTYGKARTNGKIEFQGCAISCLATPHRKRDLRQFILNGVAEFRSGIRWRDGYQRFQGEKLVKLLGREFGITPQLAHAAETVFEGMQTHGDAINFIPEFAKALPEGVNISAREADRANRRAHATLDSGYDNYCDPIGDGKHDLRARDELLDWLRNLG